MEIKKLKPLTDGVLGRRPHVCPYWMCFTFDNVFRKLFQNPEQILASYITSGSTVLDIGAGRGYFTIPIARIVGDSGKVIAADLQQKMLDALYNRALRARVENRIILHQCTPDRIGVVELIDFCLAFWMIHEVPDQHYFLSEVLSIMRPNGLLLLVEPKMHVSRQNFSETEEIAGRIGLSIIGRPEILFSYAVLLKKRDKTIIR